LADVALDEFTEPHSRDEMRLAKTIQTLAILEMLSCNSGVNGPFLIIAPLATIPN
jgi:SNF2 family DNA or RNA helicase